MSTRSERLADRATNEKNTIIFDDLLLKPHNKVCADCRKKDPRWASWNLGIFICIQCSGIHRSLGTHISKVKSVDLDTWVPEQIESMITWGNQRANAYWEGKLGNEKIQEEFMEKWIREKYEQKKWVNSETIPDPTTIEIDESRNNITVNNEKSVSQLSKDNNIGHGYYYYTHSAHYTTPDNLHKSTIEKSLPKTTPVSLPTGKISSTTEATKDKEQCKFDLASFQQQLSMLAAGRPSTGVIPKAPEGSSRSWENTIPTNNKSR